jgi:hypothetical protein
MTDLHEELETLTRRLETLEQQNAALRRTYARREPTKKRRRYDRRTLLRLGGAAAAVGAGSVLLRPGVAGATTGNMQFGAENAAGAASTGLASSNTTDTLHVTNSATGTGSANTVGLFVHMTSADNEGTAVYALNDGLTDAIVGEVTNSDSSATGAGVVGIGTSSGGVIGVSNGAGPGVRGRPNGTGPGVSGWSSNAADGMEAINDDTGRALFAHIDSTTNTAQATFSKTVGRGNAVLGQISNGASTASAVKGTSNGNGAGIEGASAHNFGGKFSGAVQLLLVPTTAASHPRSSIRGALYVDHGGRLWFCKGGTTWKQLA